MLADIQSFVWGPPLIILLVGLVFTIVYWLQSNQLFSGLARTDTRHTVSTIVQVFSVLIFLYSLRMGIEVGDATGARFFESMAAANVGLWAALAWRYACKDRRLLQRNRISPALMSHAVSSIDLQSNSVPGPAGLWNYDFDPVEGDIGGRW